MPGGEIQKQPSLSVFPNPSSGLVMLQMDAGFSGASVEVVNALGATIASETLSSGSHTLHLEKLAEEI